MERFPDGLRTDVRIFTRGDSPNLIGLFVFLGSAAFLTPGGIIVREAELKAPGGLLLGMGCVEAVVGAALMLLDTFPTVLWPKPSSAAERQ